MTVTTETFAGSYQSGIRTWVHVDPGSFGTPSGYEVLLMWDPDLLEFGSAGTTGPAPSMVSAASGFAVWVDANFASHTDFEVLLVCKEGAEGETRIDGAVLKAESLAGDKSSTSWDCG